MATKVLITGATGQVGREAVNALVAAGVAVRALVRNPSGTMGLRGAEIVEGSFDDDASLLRAFDGIETMLLAGRDSPDIVSQHQRVLAHARRVNVQHIVKLSAIGASSDSPVALMREHYAIDQEVRAGPASWTLLKPHLYMQNLLRAAHAVRKDGWLAAPMGHDCSPSSIRAMLAPPPRSCSATPSRTPVKSMRSPGPSRTATTRLRPPSPLSSAEPSPTNRSRLKPMKHGYSRRGFQAGVRLISPTSRPRISLPTMLSRPIFRCFSAAGRDRSPNS